MPPKKPDPEAADYAVTSLAAMPQILGRPRTEPIPGLPPEPTRTVQPGRSRWTAAELEGLTPAQRQDLTDLVEAAVIKVEPWSAPHEPPIAWLDARINASIAAERVECERLQSELDARKARAAEAEEAAANASDLCVEVASPLVLSDGAATSVPVGSGLRRREVALQRSSRCVLERGRNRVARAVLLSLRPNALATLAAARIRPWQDGDMQATGRPFNQWQSSGTSVLLGVS